MTPRLRSIYVQKAGIIYRFTNWISGNKIMTKRNYGYIDTRISQGHGRGDVDGKVGGE